MEGQGHWEWAMWRPRRLARLALLTSVVAILAALGPAVSPASAAYTFTSDESGANDEPGQKDLTRHGIDPAGLPTSLGVSWNWDTTGFGGANTGDACALFDNDDNGFIDFAICVTIQNSPAVQSALSPRLFTCGDDKVDRCTQPLAQIVNPTSTCTVAITATQPFAAGESTPNDTTATCNIQLADVGGTTARLVNTCSFPSNNPNSDPSDCVLIIRDGFIRIVKSASPNDATAQFNFFLDGGATAVFTSNGSGTSSIIPVATSVTHSLTETAPSGWTQQSATCSDGSPINTISVAQDETVTCTFTNVRQTGKIEVKKSLSPTGDSGLFNLQVDGANQATNVGNNGTTGEQTLNTGNHTVGETAGTSTTLGDYQKSIECRGTNGTGAIVASVGVDNAGPLTVNVTSGSDIVCVITNTRETGKIEVKKSLSPTSDSGLFNLQVDGANQATNVGNNGTTGEQTLNTGNHTVGETAGTSTTLGDYQKSIECRGTNGTGAIVASVGADNAGPLTVPVAFGDDIVCVISNSREGGKLEVKKSLSPTTDSGLFNLQIDSTTQAPNVGNNGTTGEQTLNTGNHTVGETAGTSTSLGNYQKSIECKDNNGTGSVVASVGVDNAGPLTVAVGSGDDIVCVITNTRETGKVEVKKSLSPTSDSGLFNLQVDSTTQASNVGNNGTTGEQTLNTGSHTVGETAGTSTTLSDYQKSIECKDTNGTGSVVASVGVDNAGPLTVPVAFGDDIVCTITNTRETGKLEVKKNLSPTTDPGKFNLQIDSTTQAPDVGNNGTTGEQTLNTGNHNVGETAGTSTSLSDYQKSIECKDTNGTGAVVASVSVDNAGPLTVAVGSGDDIVCTITNTRETGKLEVKKSLSPTTDPGLFNLQIDGSTDPDASDVGDAGSTGEETLNTGNHTVGETAGTSTSLGDYQKSIECKDNNGSGAVVASVGVDTAGPLTVPVGFGDDIVCTITNTRETGKLEVKKSLSPTTDPGLFNLQIDGSTDPDAGNVGDGGSTGDETVNTGNHNVGETAGTSTSLADYQKSIVCKADNGTGAIVAQTSGDDGGPLSVPVAYQDDILCTITNTRETGKLEVRKDLQPSSDSGMFDLQIDGTTDPDAINVGDGGSTGEETVNTGSHNVGEIVGTSTDLANYQKSIQCRDSNGTGAIVASVAADSAGPLSVTVGTGDDIVCTITNTRETGKLEVKKNLSPTTDPGKFNLQIDSTTQAPDVGNNGTTGEQTLNTGNHNVGETAGTSTSLADYQKSIECRGSNGTGSVVASVAADSSGPLSVTVGTGDDIVCTITNTRETGKLEVKKSLSPTTDPGLFNLQIDGSTDPDAGNVGNGGSTGEETLNTGSHNVGETAGTSTDLADYQKSIVCKADNGTGATVAQTSGDDAGPLDVSVGFGDDIVCTITNTRETGKLEVQKDLNPTTDLGRFNLEIDGSAPNLGAVNVGDGGTTGEQTLNTGNHDVSESGVVGTDLADYQKSIECKDSNGTGSVVAQTSGDDAGPLSVPVTTGDDVVCTITNTRDTGKLEVKKNLSPTTDPGKFNLQIDGSTDPDAGDVGDGGSTGEETLNTGTHSVGEIAGTNTDLADYQKSIVCRDENGTGAIVAQTSGDDGGPLNVSVATDVDIVCTITNTREAGKLEVQKDLSPSDDPGKFNLQIDGSTDPDAGNVGDGGSTGEETVNTGSHDVGETAGASTSLSDYQKAIVCKDSNGTGSIVAQTSGDDSGPLNVAVTTDADIVCVITNTRETGKLEVQKDLEPNSDPGKFNLQIDGSTDPDATNVGDGGSTSEETVNTGSHNVGETAGTSTDLADYQKSIVCRDENGTGAIVAQTSGDDGGPLNVSVATDVDIVCTITNTRETGKLEVQKDLSPSDDPGKFNLQIDGSTDPDATNVGDGGSTGEETVNTGSHTVGETAGTSTSLDDYQESIVCRADNGTGAVVAQTTGDDSGPLSVPVAYNDDVVCVISNSRQTGKLELQKDLNPSTDLGRFNLEIDGSSPNVGALNVGDGGTTGEQTLNTGSHNVGESGVVGTDLADYQKSIVCKDEDGAGSTVAQTSGDDGGPLSVSVTTGADIVCTITNTRETGKLEVQKDLEPSSDSGLINLQIDNATDPDAANVGDGGSTGEETLNTGSHDVGETAGTSTSLADYQKSIVCKAGNGTGAVVAQTSGDDGGPLSVPVTYQDDIVCTITNSRETGKLEVRKDLQPSSDSGQFDLQIDGTTDPDATNVGDGGSTGEETLNTGNHNVGEVAGTSTDLADYQKSIECRDNNGTGSVVAQTSGDDGGPLSVSVTYQDDIVCTITNSRDTGRLEVRKALSPTTDPGKFNLQIDGSTDPDAGDVGDGGSTGEETLNTGSHSVAETAGTSTDLADYQKSIECRGSNGTGAIVAQTSGDDSGPLTVAVGTGDDIVCTITNTRETGKLEVQKDLNPAEDPGKFNLQIDGNTDPDAGDVGDGGSTGEETVNTGDHSVGETAGTSTSLDAYQKSIVCKDQNGTGAVVAQTSGDDGGPLTVLVTYQDDIVCTITNTRETGKLEVKKDLIPSTDGGLFDLEIDGSSPNAGSQDVGDNGTTGEQTLNTGNHTVGETAGTSADLADYQKSIECKDQNGTGSVVAQTSGDDGGPLSVAVGSGDDIVCTITNTRETGKLEVQKDLNPASDPGKFNLQIDGSTDPDAINVGDGGSTGEETVNTGSHTVGETAGTSTSLADYQESIVCRADNGTGAVVAQTTGDDSGPLSVPVAFNDDIVCVISNSRETGKLEVRKDLEPSSDAGMFDLQIDGNTDPDAINVSDGGSTGEQTLNTGSHNVGEIAGTSTSLSDYQKSIECRNSNGTGSVVASAAADSSGPLTVAVGTGDDIVCTITNTRETGKLEVKKSLSPTTDPGKFNLQIDGSTDPDAGDVGNGGSTGEQTLNTGSHSVGETAGTSTTLGDYQKSIVCKDQNGAGSVVAQTAGDDGGPLSVPVTTGDDIVCTITNTRETGKLEIQKGLAPNSDSGKFNLQIDNATDPDAAGIGDGGSTGEETVNTGSHTVGETAGTSTDLADYQKSIVCKADNGTGSTVAQTSGDNGGPLNVSVGFGDDIVCTITNTRETGKLEVRKDLNPTTDLGRFNLEIDGSAPNLGAVNVGDGGTTGEQTLNTGNHNVSESGVVGTDLAAYTKSIVCMDDNGAGSIVAETSTDSPGPLSVPVGFTDDIVCVISNSRETGKLEVKKDLEPNSDSGKFNLQIDGTTDTDAQNVGDGGSTGEQTLSTGDHVVGETAGTSTSLGDYQKSIVCKDGNGTGAVVAQTSGDDGGPLTVALGSGDDIVCTITNTRETGKLEVKKDLEPNSDPGLFDLQIDGNTDPDAINVGDGGSTGEETVNTGSHNVGEIAGTNTDLADYQKTIDCLDNNGTGSIVAQTSGSGPLNVSVGFGDDIVCTVTNTRDTGQLEVRKQLVPSSDPGKFNLQIDNTTDPDAANVGDGGSTGAETLNTGDHSVGETAGTATTLGDYQKSIKCIDSSGEPRTVAETSWDSAALTVPVGSGDEIVCTITNTRETGKLEVKKNLIPTTDAGKFNLQIDGSTDPDAGNVGDGGSTGEETLNTGNHSVGETAGTSTSLGDYQKSIVCKASNGTGSTVAQTTGDNGGPLSVTVGSGDDIVCTITNTREAGKLEVKKDLEPNSDPGKFNLQIDGSTDPNAANVGDGGSTGEETVGTGSHSVGETAGTATSLSNYQKSIVCKANNGTGATVAQTSGDSGGPLPVIVGFGDDIVCTITNTRETGRLEVRKRLDPVTDDGRFNLQIDGTTQAANVGNGGTTGEKTLTTGDHTVGETAVAGVSLSNYMKSILCKAGNGTGALVAQGSTAGPVTVNVTDGSDIVCMITNIRKTGKLEVVKKVNPTTDPGRFDLRIDNVVEKDEAANNGTTGEKTVKTGGHTVSETADGETTLGNYSSNIVCKDGNGTGATVAQTSGSGPVTVPVLLHADVVCTITNTRKTGKLEVVKKINPTTDPGRFDLRIDNVVEKDEAANNGTTGEKTLNTGSHTVSETADGETTLAGYSSSIVCRAGNGTGATVAQGQGTSLAVQVTDGSDIVCTITNTRQSLPGRMTGGGSILNDDPRRTTHGFTLHCDVNELPNRLEINWDSGTRFHLEELTSAFCFDDPAIAPNPPVAGFDTYVGTGTGLYDGRTGATAEWTFTDAGEPGTLDTARIKITDADGNVVLEVYGFLMKGNQQAHE